MISYTPLWETMKQKKCSGYQLLKQGIDKRTLHNLRHNQNITLLTLERLTQILECGILDIVEFK